MKYCSYCGHPVSQKIPEGDNRPRFVCDECETIHYQNPRIIAGCLPIFEDRVLLCRRGIEPRSGFWTLPAGFLENGETTAMGALRETREEANANARIVDLYTIFSLPHISQVYFFFRAHLLDEGFSPGHETTDTRLFEEHEIPWDQLAFPVVTQTLQHYFNDRKDDQYPIRSLDIIIDRMRQQAQK
ncbi:MAG TPA: NUDIX hydrolase [Pseudomonadales bacterium]|nr:NUDIX hydrolase [Pseudomonadales bacterium]